MCGSGRMPVAPVSLIRQLLPDGISHSETIGDASRRTPWLQMFRPEVAEVERDDDWRFAVNSGRDYMPIFFIVRHPGKSAARTH